MTTRVLVVEDDESVRDSTVLLMQRAGLAAHAVGDGEEALHVLIDDDFDLVVLDLMLPGIDGFEVCRRLRQRSQVPVIMLSARSELEDVVAGLELGADDYVAKPFEGPELLARIRATVRRHQTDHGTRITSGDVVIDPAAYRVEMRGQEIDLTATEFRLLLELARNAGLVLTRDLLLERVWRYDYLGDSRLVDMAVKRLRDKLGDDVRAPRYISTVRGVGYRFEPSADEE